MDGYGSGTFSAGDTVHVWAREMDQSTVFINWTGDSSLLFHANEWHTSFVMPANDVSFQANYETISGSLSFESIMGADTLKPVLYHFPQDPVGVVFLFHGTGASYNIWVKSADYLQMVKDLVYHNFAIIITEAEEVTTQTEIVQDNNLRWLTDSIYIFENFNVDIQNIHALLDTFEARGLISPTLDKFAIGMSNGAIFSGTVSNALGFKAAVPYCASGVLAAYVNTSTATQWCMAKYDDNPNVGVSGYNNALGLSNLLADRGICTKETYVHDRSPIYPQIFLRTNYLTLPQSVAIYNELANFGFLDTINGYTYMNIFSEELFSIVDPTYPVLYALKNGNPTVYIAVRSVMDVTNAGHKFFSEHNKRTIDFLINQCDLADGTNETHLSTFPKIYPNPGAEFLNIEVKNQPEFSVNIFNYLGQLMMHTNNKSQLNVSSLADGLYFIEIEIGDEVFTEKFIKK